MAHRRLPGFVTEYLEAGGEDEAALARNIAALAEWRFLHRWSTCSSHDFRRDCQPRPSGKFLYMPSRIVDLALNRNIILR